LKPENLVFDTNGYLKLTDFGIAEYWSPGLDNHDVVSGTPGYMAPEVMLNRNHDQSADYFALGVIACECMTGKRPYKGKSKNQIRDKILEGSIVLEITEDCAWADYPPEACDFINQCIDTNPHKRLCGLEKVKAHPWFKDFDWEALQKLKIDPIYKPDAKAQNFDQKNIDLPYDDEGLLEEFERELQRLENHEPFKRYFYD
jgi:serine/threonine protein kinase